MKRIRSRAAAGFTLIEMLVALTLLGLIAVVLFGGLHFGTRAWEASSARAANGNEIEAVQDFLRRQMSRMLLPATTRDTDEGNETALRGEMSAFQFLATISPELGVGGIALFRLSADLSSQPGRLVLEWSIYHPDGLFSPPDAAERQRSLLKGIKTLKFRYFGRLREAEDFIWTDVWNDPERLPDLVTLDIEFVSGDLRRWPSFSVAPKLAKTATRV